MIVLFLHLADVKEYKTAIENKTVLLVYKILILTDRRLRIMAKVLRSPSIIKAAGRKNKKIEEYIGIVNSDNSEISVAKMNSPGGWEEPGQIPEFDEYTIVFKGMLKVETESQTYELRENEAIVVEKGEWVRYRTPESGGAEYVSVCIPAFSPDTVHRDKAV